MATIRFRRVSIFVEVVGASRRTYCEPPDVQKTYDLIAYDRVRFQFYKIRRAFTLHPMVFVFTLFGTKAYRYLGVVVSPTFNVDYRRVNYRVLHTSNFLVCVVVDDDE